MTDYATLQLLLDLAAAGCGLFFAALFAVLILMAWRATREGLEEVWDD